jgi:hypothetical protein
VESLEKVSSLVKEIGYGLFCKLLHAGRSLHQVRYLELKVPL